ncbi:hypothetical protein B0A50_00966 [Salinomyces thailandicus]|uniref:Uncharacterized protein n=1 Tax=Salinomyces thailandicus TaxID=706561 RepID=A0A4U0UBB8_9PEZI|nr:hypothetical protein B0A50_00966 [Salinomyces thailandica]
MNFLHATPGLSSETLPIYRVRETSSPPPYYNTTDDQAGSPQDTFPLPDQLTAPRPPAPARVARSRLPVFSATVIATVSEGDHALPTAAATDYEDLSQLESSANSEERGVDLRAVGRRWRECWWHEMIFFVFIAVPAGFALTFMGLVIAGYYV